MKKILLALTLAVCSLAIPHAQTLQRNPVAHALTPRIVEAPVLNALGQNQLYMGAYTSDALAESGLGMNAYAGVFQLATVLPLDLVQPFEGGEVKAIRFGLCSAVTDGAVVLYTLTSLSPLTIGETLVNQSVATTAAGWNQVELETPVTISTEGIEGLLLGLQYRQVKGGTNDCFPISAVNEGASLTTYLNGGSMTNNQWQDIGLSTFGNLSVQAIVEGANLPVFNLLIDRLLSSEYAKISDGLDFVAHLRNNGLQALTNYAIDVLVDDEVKGQIDSPAALNRNEYVLTGHIDLEGVASGQHTLSLRITSVDGEAVTDGATVASSFVAYHESLPRQKHLVEHFTSTSCTYCPLGVNVLEALENLCGDNMAWVSIHTNIPSSGDPFVISRGLALASYLGCNSNPSAAFDRYDANKTGAILQSLGYNASDAPMVAQYFYEDFFNANKNPVLCNLTFDGSTYDATTHELKIKVSGEATSDFEAIYGTNVGLTVYLTEDSLVSRQLNMGSWVSNYVHDRVLRRIPTAYNGDNMLWNEDNSGYENEYTVTLNDAWQAEKMHLVALVHRKGAGTDKEVINCEMIDIKNLPSPSVTLPGDINGDGKVDISDVNAVINMMLGKVEAVPAADLNGDGSVDIADVNAVINIMLGK